MKFKEFISEDANPKRQAAKAIAMKKAGKKPKSVAEGSTQKDMTGQTCEKCKKDKYQERSQHDDMEGKVTCSCGNRVNRWKNYKEKGVVEGLGKQIHGTFQSMGDSFGDAHLAKGISYFLQGRHQEGENMLRSKIPEKAQNIVFSKLKTLQAQSGLDVNKNPNIQKYIDDELVPWVKRQIQQGVAEGQEQTPDQVRQTLNAWMNKDQQFKNPTERAPFQAQVWPYIQQNIKTIFADKGADGKGSYPAAPYAAWLLVQHMDATPNNQSKFASQLEQAGLDPTDGKNGEGKLQFIKDRAAVNQEILKLNDTKKYLDKHGKPLTNPTADVRDPSKFDDAGIEYTSAADALEGAIAAGNTLLVDAVKKAQATTQPSYKQSANENFADGRHPEDKGDSKRLGVPTKSSVSNLRKYAKSHSGRAAQLAHWMANMKSGKKKAS